MLEQTLNQLYERKINPLQAVQLANKVIHGITAVVLRKALTLQNHKQRFSINLRNLNRKQKMQLQEFTVLAYWFAQKQGNIHPGEVHLTNGLSTKDYSENFRRYTLELLNKYQGGN